MKIYPADNHMAARTTADELNGFSWLTGDPRPNWQEPSADANIQQFPLHFPREGWTMIECNPTFRVLLACRDVRGNNGWLEERTYINEYALRKINGTWRVVRFKIQ